MARAATRSDVWRQSIARRTAVRVPYDGAMHRVLVLAFVVSLLIAGSSCSSTPASSCSAGCDASTPDAGTLDAGTHDDASLDAAAVDAQAADASVVSPWNGTTLTASSCSLDDVRAALASAHDGDTIQIPAGRCTWNDSLVVTAGVRILGAGIDVTTLEGGRFEMQGDRIFRVSGLTFTGTAGFDVSSHAHGWRIDHVRFDHVTGWAANRIVWVEPDAGGYTSGVVDHATFDAPQSIQVHVRETSGGGNGSWQRPLDMGGVDAVYVEDSEFLHDVVDVSAPVTDCEGGGRIVVRHSRIVNSYTEMHDAITGGLRSCRRWETYANTFETTDPGGQCAYLGIRGGTGVAFDNTFLSHPDCEPIQVALYRVNQLGDEPWDMLCGTGSGRACLGGSGDLVRCASDADCGGEPGSCLVIDGPGTTPDGYPCRDQLGTDGNALQTLAPALFWNNHFSDGALSPPFIERGDAYLVEGRDYCVGDTMPTTCGGIATTYAPLAYPHPSTVL